MRLIGEGEVGRHRFVVVGELCQTGRRYQAELTPSTPSEMSSDGSSKQKGKMIVKRYRQSTSSDMYLIVRINSFGIPQTNPSS